MADPLLAELREVLSRYGLSERPGSEPRRAGSGFSGADVWRVEATAGPLCVRRWPAEHPSGSDLMWTHSVLLQAAARGCAFVPTPRLTKSGQSFAQQRGRLWEITPWMPGVALPFGPVNESRRTAILAALAVFHTASAAARRGIAGQAAPGPRLSPGLLDRRARLERALTTDMGQIRDAPVPDGWHELAARRDEFFRLFAAVAPRVQARLGAAAAETGELIPCIRDIRREHLLFSGEQLTGWVDFGALRDEHPAADLARVLGEFFDDRPAEWDAFVAEYRRLLGDANTARISMAEIQAFDQSGILLGPLNWLRWIFLEYRDFVDRGAVVARFDQLLTRLRRLAETT